MTTPSQVFHFTASCATDVGRVRRLNEDSLLDRTDIGLWAVADGMGGHAAGDFASQTIVECLNQVEPLEDAGAFLKAVSERIQAANRCLRDEAARRDGKVIGSTVVAFIVRAGHYACLWAGDSRAYLLRDGSLIQISRDHSLVQDMVEAGQLAPEDAEGHPHANVVTRAVGAADELEIDRRNDRILNEDVLLLCSDGLTRLASDGEIAQILQANPDGTAAQVLVDLALERGAPDNVTVVAVACRSAGDGAVIGADFGGDTLPPDQTSVSGLEMPGGRAEDPLSAILSDGPADRGGSVGKGSDIPTVALAPGEIERDSMDDILGPASDTPSPRGEGPSVADGSDDPLAEILADSQDDIRSGNRLERDHDRAPPDRGAPAGAGGNKKGLKGLFGRLRGRS